MNSSPPLSNASTTDAISSRKTKLRRWAIVAVVVAGLSACYAFGPDEQTVIQKSGEWRERARQNSYAAVAIFFLVETILIGISAPVGMWLSVLAGFLFGTWLGTAVVSASSTAGAIAAFLSGRYAFATALRRSAASRPTLSRALAAIDRGFRNRGAYYVLLLRLTPLFPCWLLNLGLALTPVRLRDYWWASQLGMLPATLVICHAGASLAELTSFRDILSLNVLIALGLLPAVAFVLHRAPGWIALRATL